MCYSFLFAVIRKQKKIIWVKSVVQIIELLIQMRSNTITANNSSFKGFHVMETRGIGPHMYIRVVDTNNDVVLKTTHTIRDQRRCTGGTAIKPKILHYSTFDIEKSVAVGAKDTNDGN